MSLAEVFAESDAIYKAQVMADTWGHLDPKPGNKYEGYVLYFEDPYGQSQIFDYDFMGSTTGPMFYQYLNDFIAEETENDRYENKLVLFTGYFELLKNGNYRFVGERRAVSMTDLRLQIQNDPDAVERAKK